MVCGRAGRRKAASAAKRVLLSLATCSLVVGCTVTAEPHAAIVTSSFHHFGSSAVAYVDRGVLVRSTRPGGTARSLGIPPTISDPQVSPDGTRLLYLSGRDHDWKAWVAGTDGRHRHAVERGDALRIGCATWFPDGRRVLLAGTTLAGEWQLRMVSLTGAVTRMATPAVPIRFLCAQATPDGSQLVLALRRTTDERLEPWQMRTDGTGLRRLVPPQGCDFGYPRLSPSGKEVVVPAGCPRVALTGLWVVSLATGAKRVIRANAAAPRGPWQTTFSAPNWSADGRWLVYTRGSGRTDPQRYAVWISRADGSEPHRLTSRAGGERHAWPILLP